mmetsp:Transcript_21977/g.33141  ORF Transcript_21977/g.33141 Transcript_21977/m.33141 type:complete len:210 (-) Transcript_21977:125-754(-)|eukprot:CAMPEP_0206369212 /NCGR_PEP_ID=MMETSP0294-20121207/5163_1 /ASSEMBLY_ACC=CAM_ASM_000327 /TAXON_ID=39354 /ORGANISM="Heterosigma akashiwo, Strain CCMP2393" /LENGTH=209 /DNA_ID=CAMNT_0053815925 /DNA_START=89 /DNA_END=718 /DNA_ORIENTATION=-
MGKKGSGGGGAGRSRPSPAAQRSNALNLNSRASHQSSSTASTTRGPRSAGAGTSGSAKQQSASQIQRARALNPNNSQYWSSRGIQVPEKGGGLKYEYHGTSAKNMENIHKQGFKAGPHEHRLLGAGAYTTLDAGKAAAFAGPQGKVTRVVVNPGNMATVDARGGRNVAWRKGYDAAYIPAGEGVARPEICVKNPARVVAVGKPMDPGKL